MENVKKMTLTSEQHADLPFAGWNTQQASKNVFNLTTESIVVVTLIFFAMNYLKENAICIQTENQSSILNA